MSFVGCVFCFVFVCFCCVFVVCVFLSLFLLRICSSPIEQVKDGNAVWHKACFKCSVCSSTLTLKNFTRKGDVVFCAQHVPKEGHTQVADSVLTAHSTKSQAANMGGKIAKVHRDESGHGGGGDEGAHAGGGEEEAAPAEE